MMEPRREDCTEGVTDAMIHRQARSLAASALLCHIQGSLPSHHELLLLDIERTVT